MIYTYVIYIYIYIYSQRTYFIYTWWSNVCIYDLMLYSYVTLHNYIQWLCMDIISLYIHTGIMSKGDFFLKTTPIHALDNTTIQNACKHYRGTMSLWEVRLICWTSAPLILSKLTPQMYNLQPPWPAGPNPETHTFSALSLGTRFHDMGGIA